MSKDSFEQRLAAIHRKNCEMMPTPLLAVIQKTAVLLKRSGIEQSSLQVGESVADFTFSSPFSKPFSNEGRAQTTLYQLLETAPVIINFFRGFWCTYCREELAEYQQVIPQLLHHKKNHYMAVSPQQIIGEEVNQAQCHLVIDDQLAIARTFGIVYPVPEAEQALFGHFGMSLPKVNKTPQWELPIPATYVINQQRQVQFRSVNADFRHRLDPNDLLTIIG
ncbi:MAG: redoxin domain-containing protein [Algicola sp.]|nr:redoxin domain-containing protein [Algicola sp.]